MIFKGLGALLLAMTLFWSTALAAPEAEMRVIPYPPGLVTTTVGASAAPAEINHESSPYFTAQDYFTMASTDFRIILPHFPTYQQTQEHTCGPAAGLMVLYYYGNNDYDEMTLAKEMKTQGYPIGTNTRDMAAFFRSIGWEVKSSLESASLKTYADFKDFVWQNLQAGVPILVENVEWGGHWRVIIGYDTMDTASDLDDVLIMADSYDVSDHYQDGYAVNNGYRFFDMWFDHAMLPTDQRQQPWIVAKPHP